MTTERQPWTSRDQDRLMACRGETLASLTTALEVAPYGDGTECGNGLVRALTDASNRWARP